MTAATRPVVVALLLCVTFIAIGATAFRPSHERGAAAHAVMPATSYQVLFHGGLTIQCSHNATIRANAYTPIPQVENETFPVLIFPTSWGMPDIEYLLKDLNFAEKGYISLEYEVRGWYGSGGHIDTAGPMDVQDAFDIVDYVLSMGVQWSVNRHKIAFVGISQGAGIALVAAAHDPRISTAVSLSGWNNLTQMAYDHETPNLVWGALLELAADIVGHPSADLSNLMNDILKHQNMTWVESFLTQRSPQRFVDSVFIPRKVPLFLSSNFLDRFFRPQHMLHFYESLKQGSGKAASPSPTFLLMNQGPHAMAESVGLFFSKTYIWGKVRLWLDYFLKDIPTGIMEEPNVHMQVLQLPSWQTPLQPTAKNSNFNRKKQQPLFDSSGYQQFTTWPAPTTETQTLKLYLQPRGSSPFGSLTTSFLSSLRENVPDIIRYSASAACLSDGIPIISDVLGPVITDLGAVTTDNNIVYVTPQPVSSSTTRLCGTPRISFSVCLPNRTAPVGTPAPWQVYFFLYAVQGGGNTGVLLSDGYFTHYDDAEVQANSYGEYHLTSIASHSFCADVPAGYNLAVGFTLRNALWVPVNTDPLSGGVEFLYGEDTHIEFTTVPQ